MYQYVLVHILKFDLGTIAYIYADITGLLPINLFYVQRQFKHLSVQFVTQRIHFLPGFVSNSTPGVTKTQEVKVQNIHY